MKRTSLYLLVTLFWMLALRSVLHAQATPHPEHMQPMHQYIVQQAYALLQREAPGIAMRLDEHIGTTEAGTGPWQVQSIMAGAYREDCEDIVYGSGGPDRALWPSIRINRPGSCIGKVYDEFYAQLTGAPEIGGGLATITHFWDPAAANSTVEKQGIRVDADGAVSCLSTSDQRVYIDPPANAWQKVQKLFRPMGSALRDYWWSESDVMYDRHSIAVCKLPLRQSATDVLRLRYSTLVELYNNGACAIQLPGESLWRDVVLTADQRNRYVWEIFGRICHLLADMSVPAHTHKDMHMGNLRVSEEARWHGVYLGEVTVTVEDADSYETWIGNTVHAWWKAERIQQGLLDLTAQTDPLYFLMSSVRDLAASYASDDFDGTGTPRGMPRYTRDIPQRYNLPSGQATVMKHAMMCSIRDNTLPYTIRATATLMAWFASQLQMNAVFEVKNVGAAGFGDFFQRDDFDDPFPVIGTLSGTRFSKDVGDVLSLRSHLKPHPVTEAKFRMWKDDKHDVSTLHQFDEYVAESQGRVESVYKTSSAQLFPTVSNRDELGVGLHAVFPTFRNPWHVNPAKSNAWEVQQEQGFRAYEPRPSAVVNGGIFINSYDKVKSEEGYYSLRAAHCLDAGTLDTKSGLPALGDYVFIDWEPIYATMHFDPQNHLNPRHEDYPDPEQYDTKIVDFLSPNAVVNAHYKAHRLSVNTLAPTRINSQRKVARDDSGLYHAVYESSDRIWYVSSDDAGASWSREMLVSEFGGHAARPCIAASGSSVWIACVENAHVVIRSRSGDTWQILYSAPVVMTQDATPAIAVLNDYKGCFVRGKVICMVWEDHEVLKFTMLNNSAQLVDNQILLRGHRQHTSVDQPRFPSICTGVLPPSAPSFTQNFHIAWIENGSIFYCQLGIDRKRAPLSILGWTPGGTAVSETVHAKTGSVGAMYPARHAPSIAVTDQGIVSVAFDVSSNWSLLPGVGTRPGGLSSSFVLRERARPSLSGPTWNTTATVLSTNNPAPGLCSPSIGTQPGLGSKGSKTASRRVVYNDRHGMINVLRLDGKAEIRAHEDGSDPSITAWANSDAALLDVFSNDAAHPYDWSIQASRNNLSKSREGQLLRQRQILLHNEEAIAALGIADPRLIGNTGDERSLIWDPAHDSLVIGINTTLKDKMRTGSIIPMHGDHLRLDVERRAVSGIESSAEVLLQIKDAASGEALEVMRWPVQGFATAAGVAVEEIDLSTFAGNSLYVTADVRTHGESWSLAIADHYAFVEEEEEGTASPSLLTQKAAPTLLQNHPNPFNPETSITYTLDVEAEIHLAVFNLLGKEIAVLAEGQKPAGLHHAAFDGASLPSGVYIYRLEVDEQILTRTMHLVK